TWRTLRLAENRDAHAVLHLTWWCSLALAGASLLTTKELSKVRSFARRVGCIWLAPELGPEGRIRVQDWLAGLGVPGFTVRVGARAPHAFQDTAEVYAAAPTTTALGGGRSRIPAGEVSPLSRSGRGRPDCGLH